MTHTRQSTTGSRANDNYISRVMCRCRARLIYMYPKFVLCTWRTCCPCSSVQSPTCRVTARSLHPVSKAYTVGTIYHKIYTLLSVTSGPQLYGLLGQSHDVRMYVKQGIHTAIYAPVYYLAESGSPVSSTYLRHVFCVCAPAVHETGCLVI